MSPTSRRIFMYWLLLLIPTLVVGGGAIQLLRREQARIAEQSAYAAESRRTAAAGRARLIVENIELLTGDVQNGLLDTLSAQPEAGVDAFLDTWEKNNPLVRMGFRARLNGQLLRPTLAASSDGQRGFVRRFGPAFHAHPPWATMANEAEKSLRKTESPSLQDETSARKGITSNVAQVQSARRDVQEMLKPGNYAAPAAEAKAVEQDATSFMRRRAESEQLQRGASLSGASSGPRPNAPVPANLPPDKRGWTALPVDGHLHLLGWVVPAGALSVRGVELELAALVSRLGGALPAEVGPGEGYVLHDEQGRVIHQAGLVPRRDEPVIRVAVSDALLPGWAIAVYLNPGTSPGVRGVGFFWTGVVLVAFFVTAILAGGSLLLRQARRSEVEAAQKTSFVANVSHEFKTPLTTIRLFSELLEQGRVRDAAQGGEYLRTIGRETQRLARLVNNVLDFSRLEQGRKKFAPERLDLTVELNRLLDTHAPRMAETGMRLERALPQAPLFLTTDRDAFEQIALNLLDNVCKYAASGGELLVTLAACTPAGAMLVVADRGPGVPAAHRERIFEKFHRVDQSLTAEKNGAGLGLSIARQLARGLGGELRYRARDGGGAEFVLTLP